MILGSDGEKMSKSRGNVVNPDLVVEEHGADALRLYEMFMGPLEAVKPWQTEQVSGVVRFRNRVYSLALKNLSNEISDATARLLHKTMKKVTKDIESMSFNTAIAAMMVLVNHLSSLPEVPREAVEKLVLMLSPFAPHVSEECWRILGHSDTLAYEPWVQWDEVLCVDNTVQIGVQVNGKTRGAVDIAVQATEADAKAAALLIPGVLKLVGEQPLKKFIYVPGRIINFIV